MEQNLKTIEPLWDKYREKHIRPDCSPDDLKALAKVFYAGALLMLQEVVEINKDVWSELFAEFQEFDKEITDAPQDQRRNDTT